MKILHIRFHNLNSLAGAWHVDFTDPAYSDHSLFAITGPTGAGKSTILDAVCLALYGRTPRLPRISKSSNEIMSRHTGFCSAEVEFSTVKGKYRCHWSQHRSRKKATGELQQPKHEISDAEEGTILQSKIKQVAVTVEEVTGMDFDRFTRSTLLAQGGFAAFLEASADNRAPLLEQITGTRIYSNLSMKVHELRGIELKILADLEKDLERTELLPAEEEKQITDAVKENEQKHNDLKQTLQKKSEHLNWLQTLAALRREKQSYETQLTELVEKEKRHKEELALLQPALEAEKISPLYQKLTELLTNRKKTATSLTKIQETLTQHLKKQETLQKKLQQASLNLCRAEKDQKTGLQCIRQVEALDQQKQNISRQLAQHTNELKNLGKQQQTEKAAILRLQKQQTQEIKRQTALTDYFKTHPQDEHIGEELSALKIEIQSLTTLHGREKECAAAAIKARAAAAELEQQTVQLKNQSETHQKQTNSAAADHKKIQKQLSNLLNGNSSAAVRDELLRVTTDLQSYGELLTHLQNEQKLKNTITEQEAVLPAKKKEKSDLQTELTGLNLNITTKTREVELLEKNLLLFTRVQNLEQDRKQLREGSPCPLCGSLSHPYGTSKTPIPAEEEKNLVEAKTDLKKLQKSVLSMEKKLSKHSEHLKHLQKQHNDTEQQQTEQVQTVEKLLKDLNLPPFADTDPAVIKNKQEQLSRQQTSLQKLNRQLDTLRQEERDSEKKLREDTTLLQENEKKLLTLSHLSSAAKQQVEKIKEEHTQLLAETERTSALLFAKLQDLHIDQPNLSALPEIYENLKKAAALWKDNKKAESASALVLSDIESNLRHKEEDRDKTLIALQKEEQRVKETQQELDETSQKRTELFADKDTEKETKHLSETVKQAQKKREQLQQQDADTHSTISSSRTLLSHLEQEQRLRDVEIDRQQETLNTAIENSVFLNLEDFLKAMLDKERIETLTTLSKQLQERRTKLTTLQQDKQKHIDREEAKQLCQEDQKELLLYIARTEERLNGLQEEIISRKERLNTNAKNREKATAQLTKINRQKEITGSWNRLHSLIGSSDGKKFRNFAQGLTFEMMVNHANTTLAKMSDRYILVRDKNQPLDLNVIDSFQGGEIRSTRNLSGGESFLVSLALALGLSKMASNTIRVDSLFLDEGFGTLDEDALESALETLSSLHEENKLIGIISHVAALKERIPVQIEVIPGQGGNNRIQGPGISQST